MKLLLLTNLYPPQELGGYGRCMADFSWGLRQRGHQVQVLCSDAPYLGAPNPSDQANGEPANPNPEAISRCLGLKGSFEGGVSLLQDPGACAAIDRHNQGVVASWIAKAAWNGVLLGNLDLLGPELLAPLLEAKIPILHHVGFVYPPYEPRHFPLSPNYQIVAASLAVRQALVDAGFPVAQAPVVYPGARVELFGPSALGRSLPKGQGAGSRSNPLKIAFAGLLMGSKGAHTLVEALIRLHQAGINVQANLAGLPFQSGYQEQLETQLHQAGLGGEVRFVGQLNRPQLARFFRLHHAAVFPSIHPEAFGIVAAEAMASGLALVSSGVGGAAEVFEDGVSGLRFTAGDSGSLATALARFHTEPGLLERLGPAGQTRARSQFSVATGAAQLEALLLAGR